MKGKTVEKADWYKRWREGPVTAECHRRGSSIPLLGWRGNSRGLLDEPSGTSLEIKPRGSPRRKLPSQGRIQWRHDEKAPVMGRKGRWRPQTATRFTRPVQKGKSLLCRVPMSARRMWRHQNRINLHESSMGLKLHITAEGIIDLKDEKNKLEWRM